MFNTFFGFYGNSRCWHLMCYALARQNYISKVTLTYELMFADAVLY